METTNKGFMAKFQELLEKYVVPVATKISQQKHLASVRDGLTVLVPVTIIGGFAILLAQPPINATMQPTNFFFSFLYQLLAWNLYHLKCLYEVTFFDVIEVCKYESAFVTCFYFFYIVFESLQ